MKQLLRKSICEALERRTGLKPEDIPQFSVEVPKEESHGDFASNVAMLLARTLKRSPRDIAEMLIDDLAGLDFIEKVQIAGPGFINFSVRAKAWQAVVAEVLEKGEDFGRSRPSDPERVMVEFVSANPTGPLHFGHGRGAVVGDVLARLLSFAGHHVVREFYVNDAGAQVRALAESVVCRLKEKRGLESVFPEDGYHGDYVADLAARLSDDQIEFLPGDPNEQQLQAIQDFAIKTMLEDIQADLGAFGIDMDHFASETQIVRKGRVTEAFGELENRQLIEERDGAKWFLSDRFGDEKSRVLVKKTGANTYFATDIAYHLDKLRRGHQRLINIWGADHHGYVPRMKAALEALGHPPEALEIVLVQMVSLVRDGQPVILSKRKGEIITLRQVIEEVGSDAARFFFLLRGTDSQMEFDLELAKKRSLDNPVFYVQYGHARLSSILAKATERGISIPDPDDLAAVDLSKLELADEIRLMKKMSALKETVAKACDLQAPHMIVFYLQELVADFHHYYTAYAKLSPILGGDPQLVAARLMLVQALRVVLRNALGLLGVTAPDRME
ncbi:MAG: arginine--tRNA ligase [Deltaproteobacteria bacterium]|nr:arginine--tRNA ligase [Deltaproteobacteria bacterium]